MNDEHQPQKSAQRDARLTAFALGELNDDARAEFAAGCDEVDRAAADEIARLGGLLRRVRFAEPCPARSDDLRRAVESRLSQRESLPSGTMRPETVLPERTPSVTLPMSFWLRRRVWIPLSLAASLLVIGSTVVTLLDLPAEVSQVAKNDVKPRFGDDADPNRLVTRSNDGFELLESTKELEYAPPSLSSSSSAASLSAAVELDDDMGRGPTTGPSPPEKESKERFLSTYGGTRHAQAVGGGAAAIGGVREEQVGGERNAPERIDRDTKLMRMAESGEGQIGDSQAGDAGVGLEGRIDAGILQGGRKDLSSDSLSGNKSGGGHQGGGQRARLKLEQEVVNGNGKVGLPAASFHVEAKAGKPLSEAGADDKPDGRSGMPGGRGASTGPVGGSGGGFGAGAGGAMPGHPSATGGKPPAGATPGGPGGAPSATAGSAGATRGGASANSGGGPGEPGSGMPGGQGAPGSLPSSTGSTERGFGFLSRESHYLDSEAYAPITENHFLSVGEHPLSTFSIDVDTASYANMRRFINTRALPPPNAVRIEEMINYFSYDYPQPAGDEPFSVTTEVAGCPWNADHRLLRVGLKGRTLDADRRPASNLVFLLDVSGSMDEPNKLPLVKQAMQLLTEQLTENDRVAIVVYAGNSGLVLPPTRGNERERICAAISSLTAGGSTNGGEGIQLAYDAAQSHIVPGGTNRVILATDGDFNVGVTDLGDLERLIEEKAAGGVGLSALGFGTGNLKDATLEKLADRGNGNYAYIDTAGEARKVLVEQLSGTLVTIAKDVKLQIEFNPAQVSSYRLIGYENRVLRDQDFNDDRKDAGEIGAGHTVTALYELVPSGKPAPGGVDALKYQRVPQLAEAAKHDELATLKLRYKPPEGEKSRLLEHVIADAGQAYGRASRDFKFAASVAACGMLLRGSEFAGDATWDAVIELAGEGLGDDPHGYRSEFLELVKKAKAIAGR